MALEDFLSGTGTASDPYLIHNAAAMRAFFSTTAPCFMTNAYFSVVADIDCSGFPFNGPTTSSWHVFNAKLDGNGHKVSGISWSTQKCWNWDENTWTGEIINIHLDGVFSDSGGFCTRGGFSVLKNVRFTVRGGAVFLYSSPLSEVSGKSTVKNVIIDITSGKPFNNSNASTYNLASSVFIITSSAYGVAIQNATNLIGVNAYNPSYYSAFDPIWLIDGVSIPRLIPNGRPDLTHKRAVKGTVKVGGIAAQRTIYIFVAATMANFVKTKSLKDGSYTAIVGDVGDSVIVLHADDYGFIWSASKSYAVGDIIHPGIPNGYRYICTTAGVSSGSEPVSWPTTGTLTSGSAIFTPAPVYKPESFLVTPGIIDILTGNPV